MKHEKEFKAVAIVLAIGLLVIGGVPLYKHRHFEIPVVEGPGASAVPVGLAMVLIGFLVLLTRRSALSQLIGFVILDNGIATTAFLTSGGVPLVVELGVTLDVLLVVLILRVLTARIQSTHGGIDLDDLMELRD